MERAPARQGGNGVWGACSPARVQDRGGPAGAPVAGEKEDFMKLLVLDGNSILNRAFYGIKLLSTKDGSYTNGIYGFLTVLQKMKDECSPDAVAIAFDMRAPTFRHKMYDGYKAQRKGMPEELAQQLPNLKELLRDLGYRLVECEGYEADDILGTLARACRENGWDCVIATGDRDSLQLVGNGVTVRLATTKFGQPQVTVYDESKIMEEYGVTPAQMIDIKAIQGDTSDNIPGVAGIGPKGAGDLVRKYGSLDYIYENLDTLDIRDSMRAKLTAGRENAFLSRTLGTICTEAPIDTTLADYIPQSGDLGAAARLMAKLELFSLIDRLGLQNQPTAAEVSAADSAPLPVTFCDDPAALLRRLEKDGTACFLADIHNCSIQNIVFNNDNTICILNTEGDSSFLQKFFASKKIVKNTHDLKPVFSALDAMGLQGENLHMDTMLAGYLLNPSASGYGIQRMAAEYSVPIPPVEETAAEPEQLSMEDLIAPSNKTSLPRTMLEDAAVLPDLTARLGAEIEKNGQQKLLDEIEIPLANVLARMENIGFAVDADGIAEFGKNLEGQISDIQARIYQSVGWEFNINSPKQLGEALFERLGLRAGKKTKSGYSTSAEVLEALRNEHPAVELVLAYRTLSKLKSTYCDGLLKQIGPDGRIHSNFNQTETRTGRISSTEPNLQNIPVRTDLGREMRRFFRAADGCVLVDADYSQIELRVLAHVAEDPAMIAAFQNGDDIHRITAAQVFNMPENMVTPLMRSRAKAVNFGIVYGIGAFSLAKDIGVTRKEADDYIKAYLNHYSGVREYMNRTVEQARDCGYAETIFGRRRYLPELASSNHNLRAFGERVARNMPIQGAAADIIKIAMIRVEDRLRREGMASRLILQIHDELIVEAPEEEAERAAALLTEEMQNAVHLLVPMVADAHIGKTWYDAKG